MAVRKLINLSTSTCCCNAIEFRRRSRNSLRIAAEPASSFSSCFSSSVSTSESLPQSLGFFPKTEDIIVLLNPLPVQLGAAYVHKSFDVRQSLLPTVGVVDH